MNLTKPLIAGALAIALGLPLAACAQQAQQNPTQATQGGQRHHGMGMRMFKNLNLTPDQTTKIQSIMQQYRQAHPQGSQPDPEARKQMREQIDAVLTPEQQAQLKQERAQMRDHAKNSGVSPNPTATPT